jgi:hypothetical protein
MHRVETDMNSYIVDDQYITGSLMSERRPFLAKKLPAILLSNLSQVSVLIVFVRDISFLTIAITVTVVLILFLVNARTTCTGLQPVQHIFAAGVKLVVRVHMMKR